MTQLVDVGSVLFLTADAMKCDRCDDITVGLTFVFPVSALIPIPHSVNVLMPPEAWKALVDMVNKGLSDPKDSINGEEIPSGSIEWYTVEDWDKWGKAHD